VGAQQFDCIESLEPRNKGARLYWQGQWVATIWHSDIWGWQWARTAKEGEPSIGGQCTSFADGIDKLRTGIVWHDEAKPITPAQWEAVVSWEKRNA
jgi:hypothetical protein